MLYFKNSNYLKKILCIVLFFISNTIGFASGADLKSSLFISSQHKDFEFYKIEAYLLNSALLVSETLGIPFTKKCKIYLKDDLNKDIDVIKSKYGFLKIYLNENYNSIIENREVTSMLLKAFVFSTLKIKYSKQNSLKLAWFLNALARKLKRLAFPPIYPGASFPAVHVLLMNNYKLDPEIIMKNSILSNLKIVDQINSEIDEVLLDSILTLKCGKKFLVEYFNKVCSAQFKSNINIFYLVLSRNLSLNAKATKELFVRHLNELAFSLSVNSFMPASLNFSVNAFYSACKVSYKLKDNPKITKHCSLKDLQNNLKFMESPTNSIRELITRFAHIKSYSPVLMHKSIGKIIKALNNLEAKKDYKRYRNNIELYIKEYQESVSKEIKLLKLLKVKEVLHIRVPVRYDYYFQSIRANDIILQELWPELYNYMNKEFNFTK